jgi:hypothetical protein
MSIGILLSSHELLWDICIFTVIFKGHKRSVPPNPEFGGA